MSKLVDKLYTHEKSDAMFERALNVIPAGVYGHLGPAEGCFIPVSAFPKFSSKAQGTYFWDLDGHRYIDMMCAYGPNYLGYNDPDVDKAAIEQLKYGNLITAPSPKMVEFAELLTHMVKKDWAFFAKNGNDVTQFAMMIARAATGNKKIVLVEGYYHGVSPWQSKRDIPGTIDEDVANNIIIPWNDVEAFEKVIKKYKGEIAAFISTPYMHGNFVDNVMPAEGYWQKIRKLCTDNGIVLIIDDVRCGFRLDLSGSDHYFGFEADLICFCKALANGWNVSALCGKDFLKGAAADIPYTGSYWYSAVPFAAGIATLTKMQKEDTAKYMLNMGQKLVDGLNAVAKNNKVKLICSGAPSLYYTRIANDESLLLHQEWIAGLQRRGVFMTSHHNHFINWSFKDEDIKYICDAADESMKDLVKNHPEVNW